MSRAVVALGSNQGERMDYLRAGMAALSALPRTRTLAVSHVYETDPVGYADQPAFLNAVTLLDTGLSPRALLGACLGIESAMGRVRAFANGPRTLDMDVLLIEGVTSRADELIVPHPRMGERGFVLVPLADIFPDNRPLGFDFSEQAARVSREGIRRWKDELSSLVE